MNSSAVYAEEVVESNDVMPLSETPSTIGISFSPASGSASLSPTTTTGQSAQINVLATVSVQNSGGYAVYLKGSSINLIGQKDSSNVIPGATTAKTYNEMDVNTWGYTANEGVALLDNATYKAVSVSGNGDKVAENTNTKIRTDTKNIMLSFATKINDTKPADTYQNTITMSVVSSPLQTTLSDLINMQDMDSTTCDASALYETKQLKDTRDGKYYWVTKLADNKCWMTQNLAIDIPASGFASDTETAGNPASPNYSWKLSDMSAAWTTPSAATATTVTADTILADNTGSRSWNVGSYYIKNPSGAISCGAKKNSLADCPSHFVAMATPTSADGNVNAHYLAGNYYQWGAATAGTGGTIASGQATSSICPKGWRLPTSGAGGEFPALANEYKITNGDIASMEKLVSAPLYLVMSGHVTQSTTYLLDNIGGAGRYWSSTPNSNGTQTYNLAFWSTDAIYPDNSLFRQYGISIRCIAR